MEHPRRSNPMAVVQYGLPILPWPVHLLDERGRPYQPNAALAQTLGYPVDALNGHIFAESLTGESRRWLEEIVDTKQASPPGDYVETELDYLHRDGSIIKVQRARVGPLNNPQSPILVMLIEVAAATTLNLAEVQSRLTRVISHDLNNIFTIALSYIDLIRRQKPGAEIRADFLDRATRAIQRGVHQNEMLHTIAADPNLAAEESFLDEILPSLEPLVTKLLSPGPNWVFESAEDLPLIIAHPVMLARLVLDLCINAYLRWPHSSTLTLQTRADTADRRANIITIGPDGSSAAATAHPFELILSNARLEARSEEGEYRIEEVSLGPPIEVICDDQAIRVYLPSPTEH